MLPTRGSWPWNCPQRAARWALLRTLHDLRLSVAAGRRISLPNLLRLYRRRAAAAGVDAADLEVLTRGHESLRRRGVLSLDPACSTLPHRRG